MAKSKATLVRLVSTEKTGVFYVVRATSPKGEKKGPLMLKKYDKKARRHVVFKEAKMK